ncbi:MAG: hypothetical protein KGO50_05610 [Myxococcales bacterium]|nr:hypothetical protein [Myxococcales bacterium]
MLTFACLVTASLIKPRTALACTTCQCGTTVPLTSAGGPQSADTVRFAFEWRAQQARVGVAGINEQITRELRTDVGAAWSPGGGHSAGFSLPVMMREVSSVSGARERVFGPGDLTLYGEFLLLQNNPRHMLLALAGSRLPVSPAWNDATGERLSVDVQPGQGAFVPFMALAWSGPSWKPVRGFARASTFIPLQSRWNYRPGMSVLTTVGLEFRISPKLSMQAELDGRYELPDNFSGEEDPDSGGAMMYASPTVLWRPKSAWAAYGTLRLPVIDALRGSQSESVIVALGFAFQVPLRPTEASDPMWMAQTAVPTPVE